MGAVAGTCGSREAIANEEEDEPREKTADGKVSETSAQSPRKKRPKQKRRLSTQWLLHPHKGGQHFENDGFCEEYEEQPMSATSSGKMATSPPDIPQNTPPLPPHSTPMEVVSELPYYHPNVRGMDEVRHIMVPYITQDGYYFLRDSISKPGTYTVSVMNSGGIKHFSINKSKDDGTYFLLDKHFSTIDKLIEHHRHHDVPNLERVKGVRLLHPILPESPNSRRGPKTPHRPVPAAPGKQDPSKSLSKPTSIVVRTGDAASTGNSSSLRVIKPGDPRGFETNRGPLIKQSSEDIPLPTARKGKGDKVLKKTKSAEQMVVDKKPGFLSRFVRKQSSDDLIPKSSLDTKDKDRSKSDDIDERPPMPLPRDHAQQNKKGPGPAATTNYQYDIVREEEDQLPELMDRLKDCSTSRCDCGLYFDESELPGGWSIHLSKEEGTKGRLFFMGPENETSWNLPLEVSVELTSTQQDKIRELLHKHSPPINPVSPASQGSSADSNPEVPATTSNPHIRQGPPPESYDDVFM